VTGVSSHRSRLDDYLREHGLFVRGVAGLGDDEISSYGFETTHRDIALVGNIGSSYWPHFSRSPEFGDGRADPLDRWSRRVAGAIAEALSLQPLYPFDGPPYYPFQQWAMRAENLRQSPIGVLMHPQFGLWHSYRFALLGSALGVDKPLPGAESPCVSCAGQPCLHTCPVDAFDASGYAVDSCADFLRRTRAECHERGCLARLACPVAPDLRYADAQGAFHLRAFLQAH